MKICILSTGRTHLINTAIGLIQCGHEVVFHTATPISRCEKFGLKAKYTQSYFKFLFILFFLLRKVKLPIFAQDYLTTFSDTLLDYFVSIKMRKCDVFIGASTVAVRSAQIARNKFGAMVICDNGTKHVSEDERILNEIPGSRQMPLGCIKKALKFYDYADKIIVPAKHAHNSFVKMGVNSDKILINPYGVNEKMFPSTILKKDCQFDWIFVGSWIYRKGVNFLEEAMRLRPEIKILHIGSKGDYQLPSSPRFVHHDSVDESILSQFYAQAKCFVLPSLSEGLALVLLQAVSSGLPVIYSKDSGGEDIASLLDHPKYLVAMKETSTKGLLDAWDTVLTFLDEFNYENPRKYAHLSFENITWKAYGKRYDLFLNKL